MSIHQHYHGLILHDWIRASVGAGVCGGVLGWGVDFVFYVIPRYNYWHT